MLVASLLAVTVACETQYSDAIADFGTAATTVVQQTRSAYTVVNDTVLQQEILAVATKAAPIDSDPSKAFPLFVTDEDLNIRQALLDALQAYAAALSKLTTKASGDVDAETSKLAASMTALAGNDRLEHSFREAKHISKDEINAGSAALGAIAKFLIERKIASQLPAMLKQNQPHIDAIVTLLTREIGDTPTSDQPGGLRGKLWRTHNRLIEDQTQLVNASPAGSNEKQEKTAKLAELVRSQRNADAALAGTQAALKKLSTAHRALLQVQTAPADFKTEVAALWAQAKQAQDFYTKLPNK